MAETDALEVIVYKELEQIIAKDSHEGQVDRPTEEERDDLEHSLRKYGQRDALILSENNVLIDGYTRFRILQKLDVKSVKCEIRHFDSEKDELIYILESAIKRRHFSTLQRIKHLKKLEALDPPLVLKRMISDKGKQNIIEGRKNHPKATTQSALQGDLQQTFENNLSDNSSGRSQRPPTQRKDTRTERKRPPTTKEKHGKKAHVSKNTLRKYNELELASQQTPNKTLDRDRKRRTYGQLFEEVYHEAEKVGTAYKLLKDDQRRTKQRLDAEALARGFKLSEKVTLLNLDCTKIEKLTAIKDGSVDLIVTDPPYLDDPKLQVYKGLGRLASKKLKAGGSLVFFFGQYQLPEVINVFSRIRDLKYWWLLAVKHQKLMGARFHSRAVSVDFKPMLWYVKGERRLTDNTFSDHIQSSIPDKQRHEWAQSSVEAEYLIKNLTVSEDSVVLDPFLGSGAFAVPAIKMGRYFFGIEKDKTTFESARIFVTADTALLSEKQQTTDVIGG